MFDGTYKKNVYFKYDGKHLLLVFEAMRPAVSVWDKNEREIRTHFDELLGKAHLGRLYYPDQGYPPSSNPTRGNAQYHFYRCKVEPSVLEQLIKVCGGKALVYSELPNLRKLGNDVPVEFRTF